MKNVLGWINASPLTLLGLIYVCLFTAFGWYKYEGKFDNALVWSTKQSKLPVALYKLWLGWAGHTVGNVVVLRNPQIDQTILIHEQEHVRQMMILGILQPILYAICSLTIKIVCKQSNWYYSNCMELEARRVAGQIIDVESFQAKVVANRNSKS